MHVAIATGLVIGTSNKVSVDYQSQEVSVSVTYELERHDIDLLAFVNEKASEVEQAHTAVWRRIREIRADRKATEAVVEVKPPVEAAATVEAPPETPTEAPHETAPDMPEAPAPEPPRRTRTSRSRRSGSNGNGHVEQPEGPEGNPFGLVLTPTAPPMRGKYGPLPQAVNGSSGDGPHGDADTTHNAGSDAIAEGVDGGIGPVGESGTEGASHGANGASVSHLDLNGTDPASPAQQYAIVLMARRAHIANGALAMMLQDRFAKVSLEQLTRSEAGQLLLELQRTDRERALLARVG